MASRNLSIRSKKKRTAKPWQFFSFLFWQSRPISYNNKQLSWASTVYACNAYNLVPERASNFSFITLWTEWSSELCFELNSNENTFLLTVMRTTIMVILMTAMTKVVMVVVAMVAPVCLIEATPPQQGRLSVAQCGKCVALWCDIVWHSGAVPMPMG